MKPPGPAPCPSLISHWAGEVTWSTLHQSTVSSHLVLIQPIFVVLKCKITKNRNMVSFGILGKRKKLSWYNSMHEDTFEPQTAKNTNQTCQDTTILPANFWTFIYYNSIIPVYIYQETIPAKLWTLSFPFVFYWKFYYHLNAFYPVDEHSSSFKNFYLFISVFKHWTVALALFVQLNICLKNCKLYSPIRINLWSLTRVPRSLLLNYYILDTWYLLM